MILLIALMSCAWKNLASQWVEKEEEKIWTVIFCKWWTVLSPFWMGTLMEIHKSVILVFNMQRLIFLTWLMEYKREENPKSVPSTHFYPPSANICMNYRRHTWTLKEEWRGIVSAHNSLDKWQTCPVKASTRIVHIFLA